MTAQHEKKINWNETKEKLKQQFATLSENEKLIEIKQDEILDRLQIKLGKTKEEIIRFIKED